MTIRERVEIWLKAHGEFLNKSYLDRQIGSPEGTIQKFMKYDKKLNDNYIKKLDKVIINFLMINGKPYNKKIIENNKKL